MLSFPKKQTGFTIVELLIVIVVIAILAAITIVTYNGIQQRAENTKTINATASYVKALNSYAAVKDSFPYPFGWPCLGSANETCGVNPAGACWGIGYVSGSATFVSAMSSVITSMPALSTQTMSCNTTGGVAKGGFYYSADGKTATMYYFLKGDVSCGNPAGENPSRVQLQDTTRCIVTLTTS